MKLLKAAALILSIMCVLSLFACSAKPGDEKPVYSTAPSTAVSTTAAETEEQTLPSDDEIERVLNERLGLSTKKCFVLSAGNLEHYGYSNFKGQCEGIYISSFLDNSPLPDGNIRRGDVIMTINGKRVPSYLAAYNALIACEPGQTVTVTIFRYNIITKEYGTYKSDIVIPGGEAESIASTAASTEAAG